ncbi:MAG TPA: efflux RND transporter permease subunit [Phycisphaerales bacterium]|nr:efflux RND transporter permease subunit [Phycisphaerales bacterium]
MWIVRLALRRPYTFVVAAMLVLVLGVLSIWRMPTDVFPSVNIPVVSVVYNYSGMSPDEMETRIVGQFERFVITTVNDIDHIESHALNGIGLVRVYFQPNAKVEEAMSEVVAIAQTGLRSMPPGTQPPLIIRYSASSVPILQLAVSSDTIPEQQLFDLTINSLRNQLVTIPGIMIPWPYGGRQRQIIVDLDPDRLRAWGISPQEVSAAIGEQNLILPAGTAKIGVQEYPIRLNSSPEAAAAINDLPIRTVRGTTVYVRDVAHVRDGFQVQTNVVNVGGKRGVLLSILKQGNASTLDVVNAVKAALPEARKQLPPDLNVDLLIDQSLFVRASVEGVVKEAAIAAGLTGLMILLFLGSWRSTLVVIISIPLSILVSIITLGLLGETLNVMTLGGMALAVGILVDDATVEIENIHRNLHQRKTLVRAILDGAAQIAVPAFVATLCICIVFVPVAFISGSARYLFTPLAMAVVFAMMTSYLLSRTLVPTMVQFLLRKETQMYGGLPEEDESEPTPLRTIGQRARLAAVVGALVLGAVGFGLYQAHARGVLRPVERALAARWRSAASHPMDTALGAIAVLAAIVLVYLVGKHQLIWRVHFAFNRQFERMRRWYGGLLVWALDHRWTTTLLFGLVVVGSCGFLVPTIGEDFFPAVDAGQIRLHVRAPAGTRIEQTERIFAQVEEAIRKSIPDEELDAMLDNIGIPNSGINLSLSDVTMTSPADGEILISLKHGHRPTEEHVRALRHELPTLFPGTTFYFLPADIVTQVLNFGLASPIDVQVAGPRQNYGENLRIASAILKDLKGEPGIADLHLNEVSDVPDIRVNVDRTLASQVGLSQKDVAQDLLISLSGTLQAAPNFWMNPQNGVTYSVIVQTPQYRVDSMASLERTPIQPSVPAAMGPVEPQLLRNIATTARGESSASITHYNLARTADVQMSVHGTDLGRAGERVRSVVDKYRSQLPRGSTIVLRGQIESMSSSFRGLGAGLIFAILLVYMLMAINFQSWTDPVIILMALPGAAAGMLWMLFVTGTTINVPSLMGAIMAIGVATANSILMVTFANDHRIEHAGESARDAALIAGLTRLRPVIMTALAMIIGMLPMSLGIGEGGEQNAPLARAVIGGLVFATFTTLFFVPVCYSVMRRRSPRRHLAPELASQHDPHVEAPIDPPVQGLPSHA